MTTTTPSWSEKFQDPSWWVKVAKRAGLFFILPLFLLIFCRAMFVNFVDNYQMGYKFDSRSGEITILDEPGYYVTPPFVVSVHTIDLRPMQTCINANNRVLNCKLVQFKKDKDGLKLFLSWHGRGNYEGGSQGSGNLAEILKSYAYDGSGRSYPFLTILRDLKPQEVEPPK